MGENSGISPNNNDLKFETFQATYTLHIYRDKDQTLWSHHVDLISLHAGICSILYHSTILSMLGFAAYSTIPRFSPCWDLQHTLPFHDSLHAGICSMLCHSRFSPCTGSSILYHSVTLHAGIHSILTIHDSLHAGICSILYPFHEFSPCYWDLQHTLPFHDSLHAEICSILYHSTILSMLGFAAYSTIPRFSPCWDLQHTLPFHDSLHAEICSILYHSTILSMPGLLSTIHDSLHAASCSILYPFHDSLHAEICSILYHSDSLHAGCMPLPFHDSLHVGFAAYSAFHDSLHAGICSILYHSTILSMLGFAAYSTIPRFSPCWDL
ncbi:hypothetical protein RRG08_064777 [Elysia crispata]|uniref:Uncharacterized protein n=1 Tax=Elysia crispata TaxID=231223 RepID=A0AAE1DZF1_9GAST|nr:hypothetical protein RRG08_064777 [Elysia crispata]